MAKMIKSLKKANTKARARRGLSTGFIDKRTNIWYNVNRKTNKYKNKKVLKSGNSFRTSKL